MTNFSENQISEYTRACNEGDAPTVRRYIHQLGMDPEYKVGAPELPANDFATAIFKTVFPRKESPLYLAIRNDYSEIARDLSYAIVSKYGSDHQSAFTALNAVLKQIDTNFLGDARSGFTPNKAYLEAYNQAKHQTLFLPAEVKSWLTLRDTGRGR